MSKPIDAQAVDIPDRWVVAPTSCVVSREPPTSAFQVSKSLSHVYSFNATSSTGSLVLSRNTSELLSTLGGNPVNDALHFFDHWLPWTRSTTGIQSSPPFVFHGYRGSYGEVDGKGRAIPAPLDVRHDIHSANSEAVRFAPGPKELASLVLRFNAEESSYTALLNQGEYGTLYGDTGVSVCSDRHSDKGGTDMTKSELEPSKPDATITNSPTVIGYTTFSALTYIRNLKASAHAQHAYITSVVRFRDNDAVRHRSLILAVARHEMPNFSLRIDRFRDHTLSLARFALHRGKSNALDTVTVSENSNLLHDVRSSEEARLELSQPILLLEFGRVLEVVLIECGPYNVFAENCWFVVTMVEELLTEMFGARYVKGGAKRSRLARQTRAKIRSKLGLRDSE